MQLSMVSLWYPLFLFAMLPAVWVFRKKRSRVEAAAAITAEKDDVRA
jgi:hypothetical protein